MFRIVNDRFACIHNKSNSSGLLAVQYIREVYKDCGSAPPKCTFAADVRYSLLAAHHNKPGKPSLQAFR